MQRRLASRLDYQIGLDKAVVKKKWQKSRCSDGSWTVIEVCGFWNWRCGNGVLFYWMHYVINRLTRKSARSSQNDVNISFIYYLTSSHPPTLPVSLFPPSPSCTLSPSRTLWKHFILPYSFLRHFLYTSSSVTCFKNCNIRLLRQKYKVNIIRMNIHRGET